MPLGVFAAAPSRQKPLAGAVLNAEHPLARGLIFAETFSAGRAGPRDLVSGASGTLGAYQWTGTSDGWAVQDTATSVVTYPFDARRNCNGAALTIACRVRLFSLVNHGFFSQRENAGTDNLYFWYNQNTGANPKLALFVGYHGADSAFHDNTALWSPTTNVWYTLVGTVDPKGSRAAIYVDGVSMALNTTSFTSTPATITSGVAQIGQNFANSAIHLNGQIQWCYAWSRYLERSEAQRLTAEPFAMFEPRRRTWVLSPSLTQDLSLAGRDSTLTIGTPTVIGPHYLDLTGIASSATLGTPTLSGLITLSLAGLANPMSVGTPGITGPQTLDLNGRAGTLSVGTPHIIGPQTVSLTGRDSALTFGAPLVEIHSVVRPAGIASTTTVGLFSLGNTSAEADPRLIFRPGDGSGGYDFNNGVTCTVVFGRAGWFGMPVLLAADTIPFTNGAIVRRARYGPRTIDVPIVVRGATPAALEDEIGAIQAVCNVAHGEGRFSFVMPDGNTRYLDCRYQGGLEQGEAAGPLGEGVDHVGFLLKFYASDPFWHSSLNTVLTQTATLTLVNRGHAPAWPTITLEGPMTSFVFTNTTMGWTVVSTSDWPGLDEGQILILNHYDGSVTVDPIRGGSYPDNDPSDYRFLTRVSYLGSLGLGNNFLAVTIDDGLARIAWYDPMVAP